MRSSLKEFKLAERSELISSDGFLKCYSESTYLVALPHYN